ncbi:MAG: tetratricopeptide repeat protein [Prevotella sp.]|nr:tetratricopeptide repeat protein [Prevotella sp.]
MKALINHILPAMVLIVLLLNMTACQNDSHIVNESSEADSLDISAENMVNSVSSVGNVERTLELADSLVDQNRLKPIKADFYKSYAYYRRGDIEKMTEYLENLIKTYENSDEDPIIYTRAAIVLTDQYMTQNQYEEALRVALPTIARFGQDPTIPSDRKGRLLTIIGACQEKLNRPDEAKKSFEQAYRYFEKYMKEDDLNYFDFSSCIISVQNIFNIYTTEETLKEQKKWVERCHSLLAWYRNQPEAEPNFVDKTDGQIALKRAEILIKQGKKEGAAKAYDQFLKTDYSKTYDARLNSIDYLTCAGRYTEAADILKTLITWQRNGVWNPISMLS